MTKTIRCALVVSTLLGSGFAAQAAMLAALTGDDTLTMVDTATLKAGKQMKVTGIAGKIAGIDVRPADGMLYALGVDSTIYTIDKAGKATMKSKIDTALPAGAMATVDFNPAADRRRVIGSDGTNLRVNVDDGKTTVDGKLKFAETDMHKGEVPVIVAGAYTNSVKGTKETALYDIDGNIGSLIKQAPPNDGVLGAVASSGSCPKPSPSTSRLQLMALTPAGFWLTARCTRSIWRPERRLGQARSQASAQRRGTSRSFLRCRLALGYETLAIGERPDKFSPGDPRAGQLFRVCAFWQANDVRLWREAESNFGIRGSAEDLR
jgi:hypothetical protein